ncbi:hypothetical protein SDJN02_08496 [Cucurbita argyrosperma subsp. argyrosperma]|nr:hypothetical protein SDJN02_08496 [Cucurbita argyrosperma subsp. argyrosperma]
MFIKHNKNPLQILRFSINQIHFLRPKATRSYRPQWLRSRRVSQTKPHPHSISILLHRSRLQIPQLHVEIVVAIAPIPCLSRPRDYYVYVVREMEETPRFCKEVKKVKIPFEYSPYLDDGSFGLSLSWGPNERGCLYKAPNYEVLGVILLVAMVVISSTVIIKICQSKKQKFLKEEVQKKVFEHPYEVLKPGSDEVSV